MSRLGLPLDQGPVLEEDLGQNQSAEKETYPGATNLALGWDFQGQVTTSVLCCPPRSGLRMENTEIRYAESNCDVMRAMAYVAINTGVTHTQQV